MVPTLAALLALAGALALGLAGGSRAAFSTTLSAYVTQDGFIGINFADGSPIGKTLPAGTYTINVDDATDIHQFHLFGPGVDRETDVDSVQKQTWTVTFQAGANYSYQCDLHADIMFGQFSISGGSTSTSTSTSGSSSTSQGQSNASVVGSTASVASKSFRGALDATVFSSGKLSLSRFGKTVSTLKSGRYTFSVDDESKQSGFTVQRLRTAPVAVTGRAFVGSRDVTIALAPGQWYFYTPAGKKSYFIVTR
jgi:hypothetical protein